MQIHQIGTALKNREKSIMGLEKYKEYAVLVPLIWHEGQIHLLYEIRSSHLRRQPGEICFPGGRIDPEDSSSKQAAIRETGEELGIRVDKIEVLGELDVLLTHFDNMIHPFAGLVHVDMAEIKPNPGEVASIFTVPLDFFLEQEPDNFPVHLTVNVPETFPLHLIPGGTDYRWRTGVLPEFFYRYKEYVIWGLTARITKHFVEVIRQANK